MTAALQAFVDEDREETGSAENSSDSTGSWPAKKGNFPILASEYEEPPPAAPTGARKRHDAIVIDHGTSA